MSVPNRKQQHNAPPPTLLDAQVLRLREWAELAGVSMRTARRILASGTGPRIVQLSSKRVGVTVGAHKRWLEARERAP
jgi:predicted DNA-binding transcriptional regulator AlpA